MTMFQYFKALFRLYRVNNSFTKALCMAFREATKPTPF
jgi:hypothetical protein